MKYEKESTMERLQMAVSPSYGVVVKYGEKVLVTDVHWQGGFEAAVYQFKNPEQTDIEAPVELVQTAPERFEDAGRALAWGMGLQIAIHVEGGLVQNVWSNGPVGVEVYDLDTSEFSNEDEIEAAILRREELDEIAQDSRWTRAW